MGSDPKKRLPYQADVPAALLAAIVESTDDAIISADLQGHIASWNRAARRLLGYREADVLGRSVTIIHPPNAHPSLHVALSTVTRGESLVNVETTRRHKLGHDVPVTVTLSPIKDQDACIIGICGILRDNTERKAADDRLRASEERFRQLAEHIHAVFWFGDVDSHGDNLYVSPAYEAIWGRSVASLRESPWTWFDAIHPDDRERVREAVKKQVLGQYNETYRIVRTDGSIRWIYDRAFPVYNSDNQVVRIAGIAEDVTASKTFEARLQREEKLLRQLINIQEKERMLVSQDIHDGFVQDVVGAKMMVESAVAITEARQLMSELRPLVIDEAGIIEAIQHLIHEVKAKSELVVRFDHNVQFDRLDPMLEGALYRIVQEALTNVQRHSGCEYAVVTVSQLQNQIRIEVRDQGQGFDPQAVSPERFGLRGIQERARLFGGQASIISSPGGGTHIIAELKL